MSPGNPPAPFPSFPPVAPFDPSAYRDFLASIQGNILKPHGRDVARLLFFTCDSRRTNARAFVRDALAGKLITSADEQRAQTLSGDRLQEFFSLLLTKEFFHAFDLDLPPENGGAFQAGAYSRMGGAGGTRVWDPPYRDNPHGVWLLAHANVAGLDAMEKKVRDLVGAHHGSVRVEKEDALRWHDAGNRDALREPFGFRDGISQAGFLLPDRATHASAQLSLNQVLISASAGAHAGGSFMALQKFDQNVSAFRHFEQKMAAAYAATPGLPPPPRDAGALLVGRERDGSPLAGATAGPTNDFDFSGDPPGGRCPFHAHIRKTNPRSAAGTETAPSVKSRQFVRRGMIYDSRGQLPPFSSADYPEGNTITGEVGLLFMGYMSQVMGQFEHMRLSWIEDLDFPNATDQMPDPLINRRVAPASVWRWTPDPAKVPHLTVTVEEMPRFITSRGALFCYAPSLVWLRNL